jgi:crotonobetainyl-CoA:carnitine CoA-transferase CaiB-like acyl-CoA transferase
MKMATTASTATHADTESAAGPLSGLTVIDWTHVLSGPFTSYTLGLLGARVIRVERVDGSDIIRMQSTDPERASLEIGDAFVMLGGGKESVALDANDPRATAALTAMLSTADVLVENFRPGKLADLGFDPNELLERFPRLVVCSISGFGQKGPMAARPAYDHVIQAMSGMMVANADPHGTPQRIGAPIIDYATGMHAALAILAALHRRSAEEQSGTARTRGEWLDVSMHQTALTLLAPSYASYAVSGVERKASRATAFSGNPLSGTFNAADRYVAIVCNTQRQSGGCLAALRALGADEIEMSAIEHDIAASNTDAVHATLRRVFARWPAAHLEATLVRHDVPVAVVRSPAEAYLACNNDAQAWPGVEVPGLASRQVRAPGPGFGSNRPLTPGSLSPPPLRGEHSEAVLASLGLSFSTLERMRADGVLLAARRIDSTEKAQ